MAGLQAWLVALALAAPLFAAGVWAGRHLARIATWTARATPDGIAVSGVLTEPRTGRWDDLVTIRHSTFRTWYDLEFRDRTRIPVLRKTRGLGDLLTVIRGQAPHALERIEAEPGEGA